MAILDSVPPCVGDSGGVLVCRIMALRRMLPLDGPGEGVTQGCGAVGIAQRLVPGDRDQLERLGTTPLGRHRFRHTFATEFLRNRGDLERHHARSDPNDNWHLNP